MSDTQQQVPSQSQSTAPTPKVVWKAMLALFLQLTGLSNPWGAWVRTPQTTDGKPTGAPEFRFPTRPDFGFWTLTLTLVGQPVFDVPDMQVFYQRDRQAWGWAFPGDRGSDGNTYRRMFCHSRLIAQAIDELIAFQTAEWGVPEAPPRKTVQSAPSWDDVPF